MYDLVLTTKHNDRKVFDEFKRCYPHALWLPGYDNLVEAMRKASELSLTKMVWLATDELMLSGGWADLNMMWHPDEFDAVYPHRWQAFENDGTRFDGFMGLYLIPKSYAISDAEVEDRQLASVKVMDNFDIRVKPFDIFFISYEEKYGNINYDKLRRRFPRAIRVHGIKGIANAHRRCAELSATSMFWTVDADTLVDKSFDFSYSPGEYDRRYLHVWSSRNPVNDLAYGWGAIKLWPRDVVLGFNGNWLDYTTTAGELKIMDDCVATSAFNSDPYSSWRSGFREAVKLSRNVANGDVGESLQRLHTWLSVANGVPFADHARQGANDGLWFFSQGRTDRLVLINDFAWLRSIFEKKSDLIGRDWEAGSLDQDGIVALASKVVVDA